METCAIDSKQSSSSTCAKKEGGASVLVQEVSVGDAGHVSGDVIEKKMRQPPETPCDGNNLLGDGASDPSTYQTQTVSLYKLQRGML